MTGLNCISFYLLSTGILGFIFSDSSKYQYTMWGAQLHTLFQKKCTFGSYQFLTGRGRLIVGGANFFSFVMGFSDFVYTQSQKKRTLESCVSFLESVDR